MLTKDEFRKQAKAIRISLDIKSISEKIVQNILRLEVYKKAKNIMIFYPIGHEINLLELLKDESKNFFLPRVNGKEMLVCPYKLGDELTLSEFKTQEPKTASIDTSILDVVFVPALMVDKNNHRLGYGGGFYDRFLSKNALNATKIVTIPTALIVDKLPSDEFDAKIDLIITDKTKH